MPLEEGITFFFDPRALRNLVLVDELDSLAPIMSCQVIFNAHFFRLLAVSLLHGFEHQKSNTADSRDKPSVCMSVFSYFWLEDAVLYGYCLSVQPLISA